MWKLLKHYFMPEYTSNIDQFLAAFDETHPKLSKSQRQEQQKFRALYRLRDGNPPELENK